MKKLLLLLALLPSMAFSSDLNIWYVSADTSTLGESITVWLTGQPQAVTDTGRIYLGNGTNFKEVYKIQLYNFLTIPTELDGTRKVTFTLPTNSYFVGNNHLRANGSSTLHSLFLRSDVPDLTTSGFGVFSGFSGYETFRKVKYTYLPKITDTIEIYNEGVLFKKIPLKNIGADSIIRFNVTGLPGDVEISSNFSVKSNRSDFSWGLYTINAPIVIIPTSIIEPFSSQNYRDIQYFDILGRSVIPKEGDLIRYTPLGGVVY
jgi:hypothetical protein